MIAANMYIITIIRCHILRPYKIGMLNMSINKQSIEYEMDYIGSDDVTITEVIQMGIYNLKVPNDPAICK